MRHTLQSIIPREAMVAYEGRVISASELRRIQNDAKLAQETAAAEQGGGMQITPAAVQNSRFSRNGLDLPATAAAPRVPPGVSMMNSSKQKRKEVPPIDGLLLPRRTWSASHEGHAAPSKSDANLEKMMPHQAATLSEPRHAAGTSSGQQLMPPPPNITKRPKRTGKLLNAAQKKGVDGTPLSKRKMRQLGVRLAKDSPVAWNIVDSALDRSAFDRSVANTQNTVDTTDSQYYAALEQLDFFSPGDDE